MKHLWIVPAVAMAASCSPCRGPVQPRKSPTTAPALTAHPTPAAAPAWAAAPLPATPPPPATRPTAAPPAPATRQAARPEDARRLTELRSLLLGAQEDYLRNEGPERRGKWFLSAAGWLIECHRKEPPLTVLETLEVLGRPDYGGVNEKGATLVYLYYNPDRNRQDMVDFYFDAAGLLTSIGYNTASGRNFSAYPHFPDYRRVAGAR